MALDEIEKYYPILTDPVLVKAALLAAKTIYLEVADACDKSNSSDKLKEFVRRSAALQSLFNAKLM